MMAARLYWLLHNRAPDAGGLDMWANEMAKGVSYRDSAAGIARSNEYLGNNPVPDRSIDSLHRRLISRPVNAGRSEHY